MWASTTCTSTVRATTQKSCRRCKNTSGGPWVCCSRVAAAPIVGHPFLILPHVYFPRTCKACSSRSASFERTTFLLLASLCKALRKYALPLVTGVIVAMVWKNTAEDSYWTARARALCISEGRGQERAEEGEEGARCPELIGLSHEVTHDAIIPGWQILGHDVPSLDP